MTRACLRYPGHPRPTNVVGPREALTRLEGSFHDTACPRFPRCLQELCAAGWCEEHSPVLRWTCRGCPRTSRAAWVAHRGPLRPRQPARWCAIHGTPRHEVHGQWRCPHCDAAGYALRAARRGPPAPCRLCGAAKIHGRGLCPRCYSRTHARRAKGLAGSGAAYLMEETP